MKSFHPGIASILLAIAIAQTPPGFNVTTSTTINLIGQPGNIAITPDLLVPQSDVLNTPNIYLPTSADNNGVFLAVMMDPDAPNFLHWMQPNLVADPATRNLSVNAGAVGASPSAIGAPYIYPQPPVSPPHHYIHLLYAQPTNLSLPATLNPPVDVYARLNFTILAFQSAAGLDGALVGANYFRVLNGTDAESSFYATATGTATFSSNSAIASASATSAVSGTGSSTTTGGGIATYSANSGAGRLKTAWGIL